MSENEKLPTNVEEKPYVDVHQNLNQQEQEDLLAPFMTKFEKFRNAAKKSIFVRLSAKLWQLAHDPIRKLNWLSFITIIVLFVSITFVAMNYKASRTRESGVGYQQFGIMNQLEQLKKTHEYYTKVATKEERLMRWVMAFSNWKYQTDGDPKKLEGDCVGALYHYFSKWGSNFQLENIPWLITRTQNLASRGELKIRKSISDVQSGDIIILKISESNQHLGVVYTTTGNWIQYMDMNVATNMGLEKIQWGNGWITSVVEVSYSLWIGNLMSELNK